jgi:GxxExxY protein
MKIEAGNQEAMREPIDDPLTSQVIGTAIAVHRELGPGFLESIYEEAMAVALTEAALNFKRQMPVPIRFRGRVLGEHRLDLLVENDLVVELKAVSAFENIHIAVVRSYLRATGGSRGLLINFSAPTLQVKRIGAEFRPKA